VKPWSRRRRRTVEAPIEAPAAPSTVDIVAAERDRAAAAREATARELARTRAEYDRALADSGVVVVQQVAADVDAFHVSRSMSQVMGWAPATFRTPGVLRAMVHPDDLPVFGTVFPPPGASVDPAAVIDLTDTPAPVAPAPVRLAIDDPVVRFRTGAGSWAQVQLRRAPIDPERVDAPLGGSLIDVTPEERSRRTTRHFAEVARRDPAGTLLVEFTDRADPSSLVVLDANPAARAMLRLEQDLVDDTPIDAVLGAASSQLIRSALFDVCHTGESMTAERLSLAEVRGTYLDLRVDRLDDGTLSMTLEDVTGTVALEDRLRHQASHDALTSLPNRALFEERLAGTLATASVDAPVALVLVDIDGFRDVNEAYGLHLGDQLLVEVGRRLVREVRGAAVVSRIDGDQFAVLTMRCSSVPEATERAAAVSAVLDRPFDVDGHLIALQASVGVVLAPVHAEDARTALRFALAALERAKSDDGRFAVHEPDATSGSIHRLALLAELRQGLANQDLELRYQPIVDLRTGRVDRVDAVVRWRQDREGTHLPVEFLELAEQSGLIQPLTRWILGEAAAASRQLTRDEQPLVVCTTLSLRNLCDPDLVTFISLLIASGELDPALVELQVGETELMDDPVRSREVLSQLHDLGLRIVVDEFGTGYTSLSTMQHLPVDTLKIDRSFVSSIVDNAADASIVRSTIELSHELGLRVGADGVGDAETLSMLAAFGCDHAQGAHLSEPVRADVLAARIEQLESAVRGWIGTSA
jgi:diguanylate cyclase (GGDEF)-like protein